MDETNQNIGFFLFSCPLIFFTGGGGANNNATSIQSTLDEITNRVFNELLKRKVDAHAQLHGLMPKTPTTSPLPVSESISSQSERNQPSQNQTQLRHSSLIQQQPTTGIVPASQMQAKRSSDGEDGDGRSDDWCSETSNAGQLRQPNAKGRAFVAANRHRKYTITPSASMSLVPSAVNAVTETEMKLMKQTPDGSIADENSKKPLIAIWKAGVKLQNASAPAQAQAQAENNGMYSPIPTIQVYLLKIIRD